uniref:Glycosyltransferase n=1 Tax=viral metagenome TaxID=1070528 RepID=A0A6C0I4D2_9ZZZZ
MNTTILLFIIIVLFIYSIVTLFRAIRTREGFSDTAQNSIGKPTPEYMTVLAEHQKKGMFPWRWLKNEKGQLLPIVLVSAFFRDDESRNRYKEYIDNGVKVVGITAYKTFIKPIYDPSEDTYHHRDDFDYAGLIKNWLVCFKDYREYGFTDQHNVMDISESDFYDVEPEEKTKVAKKYDIIYVCLKDNDFCPKDGWNAINRNFELAQKCLPIMIKEFGLKVLIIGRVGCGLEELYGRENIEVTDFLPWSTFQEKLRESRILFVPNIMDASPRVIAEAMIKGLPVIMNRNIVCGSKYVAPETGELFNDDTDFGAALSRTLKKYDSISPKAVQSWWASHYGINRSAKRLRDFLVACYPGLVDDSQEVSFF